MELSEKHINIVKLEIVCTDEVTRRIVEIIGGNARTRQKGDGLVFVTPVEGVVRISSGKPWTDMKICSLCHVCLQE